MASALVGEFGEVMRLGLLGVLGDAAILCVGESAEEVDPSNDESEESALLQRLEDIQPDAVVVNWDDRRYEAVAASVLARRPEVTVIACSSERLAMRVLPARGSLRPYESRLSAQGLVEAVEAASAR